MDARCWRFFGAAAVIISGLGASHRTTNFIVSAPNRPLAQEIGIAAERYRGNLAREWLNRDLPQWSEPCPITVEISPHAGGETSFIFRGRQPFGWRMRIQGSRERILDSVLPHEITHTIFATHFGQPLPRWADEGACTTVEHESERRKQDQWLLRFLQQDRGIPFNHMFAMTEYPRDIMPLYAQGYSVARFLIHQGGKPKFVQFVGDGLRSNNWNSAIAKHYGYRRVGDLQVAWENWLGQGQPLPMWEGPQGTVQLASTRTHDVGPWSPGSTKRFGPAIENRPIIERAATDDQSADSESWYELRSREKDRLVVRSASRPPASSFAVRRFAPPNANISRGRDHRPLDTANQSVDSRSTTANRRH
jgi:hypothetical protein